MAGKLNVEIIDPSQFEAVLSAMPNPNEIFTDKANFYELVDEMLLDGKVGSHLRLRKDIVASFPFIIEKGNSDDVVYEFVRDNLKENLNWENDVKEFLNAIEYGFSFSEVLWTQDNKGRWIPDSLRNKKPGQIVFKSKKIKKGTAKKTIWIPVLKSEDKELTDNYKFLVYRHNPRAENPYGYSDLLMCYWAWQFKQLGWEFWLQAAKKAGVPSILALFKSSNKEEAQANAHIISEALSSLEGGAGLALSNVDKVETLNMSGALKDHKVLIDTCNQEISFALTTQSLSTQEGVYGTRAQAEVHDDNLIRVCHGDAKAVQGVFQELINWMVELNYPGSVPPKGYFDLESYATFAEVIQAIEKKIPVSLEALYTRYGLPRPANDDDVFIIDSEHSLQLSDKETRKKKRHTKIY